MQKILKVDLQNSKALISNEDTKTMEEVELKHFSFSPQEGEYVNMYKNGDNYFIEKASNVATQASTTANSGETKKINKIMYILVAIFLGGIGVHKFICGKPLIGILYILLTLFTFVIGWILSIIDIIKVAQLSEDAQGNVELNTKGFFEK